MDPCGTPYRCHGNVILEENIMRNLRWVLNTLANFRLDMISLTVSKGKICLFV